MKRYDPSYNCDMDKDPTGYYVEYEEAAELIQKLVNCIHHYRRGIQVSEKELATYYANGGLSQTKALEFAAKSGFKPSNP